MGFSRAAEKLDDFGVRAESWAPGGMREQQEEQESSGKLHARIGPTKRLSTKENPKG